MSGAEHVPTGIEAAVCADIARRQAFGIAKYGQTVANNPLDVRSWLQHAYEECLDQAVYLKRAIAEIDSLMEMAGDLPAEVSLTRAAALEAREWLKTGPGGDVPRSSIALLAALGAAVADGAKDVQP